MLQIKSGFIYHVSKIHSLPNTRTETIFIFVGINPRKSVLKKGVLMEFSSSRVKANTIAQCNYCLSSQDEVWLYYGHREVTELKLSHKDSHLWLTQVKHRRKRSSLIQFYFSCFSVSVLPPEGALRGPLNSEDIFRSLQFRKYNTKFINIWLRSDPYLQNHTTTATDARTAPRPVSPSLGEQVLLQPSRTPSRDEHMWPYLLLRHKVGKTVPGRQFSAPSQAFPCCILVLTSTGAGVSLGVEHFRSQLIFLPTSIPTHHPGRVHLKGNSQKYII